MTAMPSDGRPTWPYEPLYIFLHRSLPALRKPTGILDVTALADELHVSRESIYKWFRRGNLPARRVRQIHEIALRDSNLAALAGEDIDAPELAAFYEFSA